MGKFDEYLANIDVKTRLSAEIDEWGVRSGIVRTNIQFGIRSNNLNKAGMISKYKRRDFEHYGEQIFFRYPPSADLIGRPAAIVVLMSYYSSFELDDLRIAAHKEGLTVQTPLPEVEWDLNTDIVTVAMVTREALGRFHDRSTFGSEVAVVGNVAQPLLDCYFQALGLLSDNIERLPGGGRSE